MTDPIITDCQRLARLNVRTLRGVIDSLRHIGLTADAHALQQLARENARFLEDLGEDTGVFRALAEGQPLVIEVDRRANFDLERDSLEMTEGTRTPPPPPPSHTRGRRPNRS